jgi:AcrR family transcriptional regulator
MATSGQEERRVGRPRSKQSQQAILAAALEVLADNGYEAMSIEQVAARAGVGKTTIYRWWISKEELVIDAIKTVQAEVPIIDTGSFRTDAIAIIQNAILVWNAHQRLFVRLIGEVYAHAELFEAFRSRLMEPRLQAFAEMIRRAQERGELRKDIDPQTIFEIMGGSLWFQFLFSGSTPVSLAHVERILDALLQGFADR